jgi:hypothetical protein
MGNMPLPALALQLPQQQDPIANYGRILQIRNLLQEQPLRQQMLQQQLQTGQLQNQELQQNNAARQALNQAYAGAVTKNSDGSTSFDPDKLQQGLANGPAAYQTPAVMKGITDFQKSRVDLQTATTDLQQKQADLIGNAAAAVKAANYDPTLAHSFFDSMPPSPQINALRAQIDNPAALKQMVDTALMNSPKQRELGAAEQTAGARAQAAQTEAAKFAATKDPNSPLYSPSQASVALGTAPGAAQIQQGEAKQAAIKAGAEASARQPYEIGLARARQAIQDGDPKAAAQLLISGDVAPSQLISSRKPEFAQQAFTAAHNLSGGTWNAESAEANFKVASSPANVAFFGSAKSLTDKGGTLDQLANAARDIPSNQVPIFNSVADAVQAASGTGPIAKYAALALGVADDYSKVMGGGTGSDSSRAQALQLIGAKQSPNQRAASIEGIRGAVTSQTNSRIGNNTVMQRMYGTPQAGAPAGGYVRIQASDGSLHDLPQANLDKARQRDPGLKVVNQ